MKKKGHSRFINCKENRLSGFVIKVIACSFGIITKNCGGLNFISLLYSLLAVNFCIQKSYIILFCNIYMSHFAYACKTKGKNGISCFISALCVNCLISIPEYSRIIDYSIIWMCIWCGVLQKLYKIKKSELLNSKV